MRRSRLLTTCLASLALTAVCAGGATAKTDKTYAIAKTACSSLPQDRLAQALGLPAGASAQQIATAYAKKQKTAAKRRSAKRGCLAGLQNHH